VTLSGLAEVSAGGNDEEAVKALFVALGVQDVAIKKVRSVGATTQARPHSIVVEMDFESYEARCTALKNRSMLKERAEYSNVYIMPEL
jgi:hypothetical protein